MKIACVGVLSIIELEGSYSFIVLHCTHSYVLRCRTAGWYRQCAVVVSRYGLMFIYLLMRGEKDRHIVFLMSPISSYCYDMMTTLSVCLSVCLRKEFSCSQSVSQYPTLDPEQCSFYCSQSVSQYPALDPRTVLILLQSVSLAVPALDPEQCSFYCSQSVSLAVPALDPRTVLILLQSVSQSRSTST